MLLCSTIHIKPSPSPARCRRSSTLRHSPDSLSSSLELTFLPPSSFSLSRRLLTLPVHHCNISTISLIRDICSNSSNWFCWLRNWIICNCGILGRSHWFPILKHLFQKLTFNIDLPPLICIHQCLWYQHKIYDGCVMHSIKCMNLVKIMIMTGNSSKLNNNPPTLWQAQICSTKTWGRGIVGAIISVLPP